MKTTSLCVSMDVGVYVYVSHKVPSKFFDCSVSLVLVLGTVMRQVFGSNHDIEVATQAVSRYPLPGTMIECDC